MTAALEMRDAMPLPRHSACGSHEPLAASENDNTVIEPKVHAGFSAAC